MWASCYVTGKSLASLLAAMLVTRTMQKVLISLSIYNSIFFSPRLLFILVKGLCEASLLGFAVFGFNLGPYLKDYRTAYQFGKVAVALADMQYNSFFVPLLSLKLFIYCYIVTHKRWCKEEYTFYSQCTSRGVTQSTSGSLPSSFTSIHL